jgi:MFS transporter, MFS domain-containing protein family, molybdate-anion transporter
MVSTLFTTGFLTGAVSAYATGTLADRHGRRLACLVFCGTYALSCALTMVPSLPFLFAGRVLGGVGTSLLFSVFESWMVTDFHARRLADKGGDLSRTFGVMSTLNSVVAIASGVFSEWAVAVSGTRKAPFAASVVLLAAAGWVISTRWDENYGDSAKDKGNGKEPKADAGGKNDDGGGAAPKPKLREMLKDPRIVCLGLASTMFEGSMYLFVFMWGPALQSAHAYETVSSSSSSSAAAGLPYGIIFASFMASVLAASLLFNIAMDNKLLKYTYLLAGILGAADLVFYLLEQPRSEQLTFWLFCLFEACVGMYWPCMGYLKGQLVDDGVRAQLYGILRVPLNVFVVVSLYFTGDGDSYAKVFAVCSRLLLVSIGGLYAMVMNEDELP